MHETLLLAQVVRLVEERLASSPDRRPVAVRIRVSPWSHMWQHDERSLKDAFSMVASGTRAEGAVLRVQKATVLKACPTCAREQTVVEPVVACSACGSLILSLADGPEVWLQDIEVEET